MPQGRIILKRICQSRKLADLKSDGARLLYTWLIPNVDINGCFSGDPEVVKGQVFTRLRKSVRTIRGYMEDLVSVGLIVLYEANGDVFINIPDFVEKQPSLNPDREAESAIPPPTPEQLQSGSGRTPTQVKLSKVKVKSSKGKVFVPPKLEDVKKYVKDNPELSNVDPVNFFKSFHDGGWIDTRGNPVRNWKLKLRTWSNYGTKGAAAGGKTKLFPIAGKTCGKAGCCLPAIYKDTGGAYDNYCCGDHMPAAVKEKYSS